MTLPGAQVSMAFEPDGVVIAVCDILPVKQLPPTIKKSRKYQQIAASIREVGLIEPPIVARQGSNKKAFLLVDGHLRIEILKDLEIASVNCLVAMDDEGFTYNKRISRLATIQEHKMILKAIDRGVPEDRIAKALNVDPKAIREKRQLLDGICQEAADLLNDKHCPIGTFRSLKKMKPLRQIEVAELMIAMNNFTVSYSKAMFEATPQSIIVESGNRKKIKSLSSEQFTRMEKEMTNLQSGMKLIEDSYGSDHLDVVIARGYLSSLLSNGPVIRYLTQHYREILKGFRKIHESISIGPEPPD